MVDNLGAFDHPVGIQHHHGVQGLAGVGRSLDKIDRLVGIAHQLFPGIKFLDGPVTLNRAEISHPGNGSLDHLAPGQRVVFREGLSGNGAGQKQQQKRQSNPGDSNHKEFPKHV